MTKQNVTNLFAGAIIAVAGAALARPAHAEEFTPCMDAHQEAVEAGAAMCGAMGYSYARVTTYCTGGTATSSKVVWVNET